MAIKKVQKVGEARRDMRERILNLLTNMSKGLVSELAPIFDAQSAIGYTIPEATKYLKVRPGEEFAILDKLAQRDLLAKRPVKSVHLCPFCNSFHLKIHVACPKCKSEYLRRSSLLHHFQCGHIDVEENFEQGQQLVCPKCHKVLRHIGVDYEKLSEVLICLNCSTQIPSPHEGYECLKCGRMFSKDQAVSAEIYRYTLTQEAPRLIAEGKILENENPDIDELTGVYKEEVFANAVLQEKKRLARYGGSASTIKLEFINWPNWLNQVGWRTCQLIIKEIARLLKENLREVDTIGRQDEHTFGILLTETSNDNAKIVEQKISKALSAFFETRYKNIFRFRPVFRISHTPLGAKKSTDTREARPG